MYFEKVLTLMRDVNNKTTQIHIVNLFQNTSSVHSYNTRSSTSGNVYMRVSMGWWRLRLTAKNLAFLRLTVSFFPLRLTEKLKINFLCFKKLNINKPLYSLSFKANCKLQVFGPSRDEIN